MDAQEMMDKWAATVKALLGVESAARKMVAQCRCWSGTGPTARAAKALREAVEALDNARKGG